MTRAARSPREVFESHLALAMDFDVDADLSENFAADVVVLTGFGVFEGHDGIRALAELLRQQLPSARFVYTTQVVRDEFAYLEWTAEADGARVRDGADSFVFRDGLVVAQTIHYTVEPESR